MLPRLGREGGAFDTLRDAFNVSDLAYSCEEMNVRFDSPIRSKMSQLGKQTCPRQATSTLCSQALLKAEKDE